MSSLVPLPHDIFLVIFFHDFSSAQSAYALRISQDMRAEQTSIFDSSMSELQVHFNRREEVGAELDQSFCRLFQSAQRIARIRPCSFAEGGTRVTGAGQRG